MPKKKAVNFQISGSAIGMRILIQEGKKDTQKRKILGINLLIFF
jgi:hypothetical protein